MILITEFMDEAWVDWLRDRAPVTYAPDLPDRPDDLARLAKDATALIVRNRTQVRGDLLAAGFTCVGRLGVGLDNIDLDGCTTRGIEVFPATGANTLSVAEYVITTAAVLLRGAYLMREQMEAGDWPRVAAGQGREIAGKVLGLVGYGGIARETARLGRALGMDIAGYDPFLPNGTSAWGDTRPLSLEALLAEADVVSLHVPLTDSTRHLIDADAIDGMKPGAVVVNAARGGVVDEPALCAALCDGRLAGAALDTFEKEPLGADNPFAGVPNLILTPHIGGVTAEANARVSEMTARKVAAHLGL
ncbi:MAG: hydroxyacid dehydrogenase [Pseudomonadota bacterium]